MTELTADRPQPSRLRRWVRVAVGILAVGLLGGALWQQRTGLADALERMDLPAVLLSGGLALIALLASMLAWRAVLLSAGHRLPLPTAARLYFLTQIGKYLPGSVWPVVAQMDLGREQGISAAVSGVAAVLNLVVGVGTGVVVGLVSLLVSGRATGAYWWLVFTLPLLLALLHPRVIRTTVNSILRLARRPVRDVRLAGRHLSEAAAWSLAMWLLFGLHVHVLVTAVGGPGAVARSVGAYALAWVAGFLVFFAPAGAGARELSLVVLLSPPLGQPEALAVAVLSRVISIIADVAAAAAGVVATARRRHG